MHLPLAKRFLKFVEAFVSEGDEVEYEQKIGEPVDEGFLIGVWASADGTISSIEDEVVTISGGAILLEEAEAARQAYRVRI